MKNIEIKFSSKVWKYNGAKACWYFVSLSEDDSLQIKYHNIFRLRGWGSLPVIVKIGKTEWKTSIFPDSKKGCYILPIKAAIRKAENIAESDEIEVDLKVA